MDPTVGKLVAVFIGVLIISVLIRFFKSYLSGYIKDTNNRYRVRKFVTFIGYITCIRRAGASASPPQPSSSLTCRNSK